jgi:hypothetical protein
MMSLNDVWRNLSEEIGIFWKGRWDNVPSGPGVYGWFYPLRISTHDLNAFLDDIAKVLSFDARYNGVAACELRARLTWEDIKVGLSVSPSFPGLPQDVVALWSTVVSDPARFERMRRVVMRGSLLMPPLYVGKATSLSVRCQQHLVGTTNNDFHRRYEEFARKMSLQAAEVNDLLFACIRTARDAPGEEDDAIEGIVEEILKRACRPKYSIK